MFIIKTVVPPTTPRSRESVTFSVKLFRGGMEVDPAKSRFCRNYKLQGNLVCFTNLSEINEFLEVLATQKEEETKDFDYASENYGFDLQSHRKEVEKRCYEYEKAILKKYERN